MPEKTIMILGAGPEQVEAIDIAKNLGLKVIAVDGNPNAEGLEIAHIGLAEDIKDVNRMIEIGQTYEIDGVMTHAVEIPQIVAKVAKSLNLPGLEPEVAERATNKLKRIECFKENGIPCANFESANNLEEAIEKSEKIGFPCVFKPLDKAGARGVIKINSLKEVKNAYEHVLKNTEKNIILIEEYLEGKEISTESIVYNGDIHHIGIGDRNYDRKGFEPFFVQDGGQIPAKLSNELMKNLKNEIESAIRAIGINWGVAKGDFLIEPDGKIKIIEMAARTSGGRFCSIRVPLSNGINLIKLLVLISVGEEVNLDELKPKFSRYVADRFILPEPGKIVSIDGLDDAMKLEGIYNIYLDKELIIGNEIGIFTDNTCRKGQIIAVGNTYEESVNKAEKAVNLIKINTRGGK
ncbi:MAG: ATP-grasp domain-containing protein [Methanobacterium sp.]|uniref:ATP-grasp domain-containing protein n=1 Tax=Methanobacterium sp. TaxID=2164 RepID=UPI003C736333